MKLPIRKAITALSGPGFLVLANHYYSQTNTLPSPGIVGIGTMSPSALQQELSKESEHQIQR